MSKLYFTRISAGAIILGSILFQISCGNKDSRTEIPLDAASYELEIIDSVMIDYLGALSWSDISSNGRYILGYNYQNSDILLFSTEGEVLGTFNKTGDQPDAIGGSPLSRPQFVKENEWAILGGKGVYAYNFQGELTRTAKPDFSVSLSVTISNANILHFLDEDRALAHFMGRDESSTFYINPKSTQLEISNLKRGDFTAALPLPEGSKFKNPEKIHNLLTASPAMDIHNGKLYIAFKNEPKLWVYDLNDLEKPIKEITIFFDKFIQKDGVSPDKAEDDNVGINIKDFTYGSIDKIIAHNDMILIHYTNGLTETEYNEVNEGLENPMDAFSAIFKMNKRKYAFLGNDGTIKPINLPENVGNIEFVDKDGIYWLSYNREEELDYELIFKAKLKAGK